MGPWGPGPAWEGAMTEGGVLLVASADEGCREALTRALEGLGTVRAVTSAGEALGEIGRRAPRAAVLVADLPGDGVVAIARALPSPLSVTALVPEGSTDVASSLAEVGVLTQLPVSVPSGTLRRIVEHLCARADSDDSERLQRVLTAVSRVRHDANNPLTSILAETQLLLMDASSLTPEVEKGVKAIHEMAVRIRDVLRELQAPGANP